MDCRMSEYPERIMTTMVTVRLMAAGWETKSDHAPLHVEHVQPVPEYEKSPIDIATQTRTL